MRGSEAVRDDVCQVVSLFLFLCGLSDIIYIAGPCKRKKNVYCKEKQGFCCRDKLCVTKRESLCRVMPDYDIKGHKITRTKLE